MANRAHKTLYCIGAGELQRNLFRWAKEMGFYIHATDRNQWAGALGLADSYSLMDALDVDTHMRRLKELEEDPDHKLAGVISSSHEGATYCVAVMMQHLGRAYHDPDKVKFSLEKTYQYTVLDEEGVAVPKWTVMDSSCVKPSSGSGSTGVFMVPAGSLCQEAIEGRHIDINGLYVDGMLWCLGMEERWMQQGSHPVPLKGVDPAPLESLQRYQARDTFHDACVALGLSENGPVKADMVMDRHGKFWILEVTPRFHGECWTSYSQPYGSGINAWKFYLSYLMDGEPDMRHMEAHSGPVSHWRVINEDNPVIAPAQAHRIGRWTKDAKAKPPYTSTADIPGYEFYSSEPPSDEDAVSPQFTFRQEGVQDPRCKPVKPLP